MRGSRLGLPETEPKIKFYFGVNENSLKNAMSKIDEMKACVQELVK